MMKTKVLVSAFAATLLGLSSAAFAQSTGTRGIAGGTAGQDNPGANEAPATGANGANAYGASAGSTAVTGRDARYDRRHGASRGSSTDNSYEPQRPSMSNDKTDPQHPNVRNAEPNPNR
jgi:hypothetical protein